MILAGVAGGLLLSGCASRGGDVVRDPAIATRAVLTPETRPDPDLQRAVEAADARIRDELGLADDRRAFGVLDLVDARAALIRPDAQFYGASVPKIAIALGYFERFPEAAVDLDPAVRRELELVIKRSDNDLAARYSQLVGLDFLQEMLTGQKYRLYDAGHGGGIWCGKHYGLDTPRTGDPLDDHSHAVTVRQCLRYYLMLERGDFGPQASARLREIFRAPELEFHDSNFVTGLTGRDVTMVRKSGLWEDWRLDTARVRHGERVYLLAGATHHPEGGTYLARMAAAVDEILCGASDPVPARHRLALHDLAGVSGWKLAPGSQGTSETVTPGDWFNEVVPSWNVTTEPGDGFVVELRVGRAFEERWSPWLHVGDWGPAPARDARVTEFPGGAIDIDYFRSDQRYDRLQYRVTAAAGNAAPLFVERFAACVSDTTGRPLAVRPVVEPQPRPSRSDWQRNLAVPFRSQKSEPAEIAGRICSPTSVSMVLDYHGLARSTRTVADACLDAAHDLYGVWPRNVQAAWTFGSPGYLARFSDWAAVERMIAAGQPLVISIRVRREGDLRGAPYKTTAGHLLVLTGFAGDDLVQVNDPAGKTPEAGQVRYHREDLEKVWMRATGGLAYVLKPAESNR